MRVHSAKVQTEVWGVRGCVVSLAGVVLEFVVIKTGIRGMLCSVRILYESRERRSYYVAMKDQIRAQRLSLKGWHDEVHVV